MEDGRPSQTAFIMAVLRAHHLLTAPPPRVLDDDLSMALIGLRSRDDVAAIVARFTDMLAQSGDRAAVEERVHAIMMGTCARSRHGEDRLAAMIDRGARQLVVLGAGLDTLAYRRSGGASGLSVFEVDHPATQTWKRGRLRAAGIAIPDELTFVPCDFERQTLAEALAEGGVRRDRMTLFVWLGVQPYLTDESVMATLETVAGFPSGSELVMDLLTEPPTAPGDRVRSSSDSLLATIGEPWRSWYAPPLFETLLRERGFTTIDSVSFPDWLRRNGERFGHRFTAQPTPFVIVSAEVG